MSVRDRLLNFRRLAEIDVDDRTSWEDALFLTIDVDWACDDVLADTLDLIEEADIPATFFLTHDTRMLQRLRSNPRFELGIHPNFNHILNGTPQDDCTSATHVVDRISSVIPEATSCRSHSLSWGDVISRAVRSAGITTVSNQLVPEQSGIALAPYRDWYGLVHVPYFYQDSATFYFEQNGRMEHLVRRPGLKIFDFHPIHVFLNSECADRFERVRDWYHDAAELKRNRYSGDGIRTAFRALLGLS